MAGGQPVLCTVPRVDGLFIVAAELTLDLDDRPDTGKERDEDNG